MNDYKGRVTYAQGTYLEFVVAPKQDVDFGDILVVEGNNGDYFYVRVYDFKVKSRWSGINGVNYLMSKLDDEGQVQNKEELEFYLGGNHMVKIGLAEQLCYADPEGTLFNPKTCPDFFCEIRTLNQKDELFLRDIRGDLEIGYLKSGRKVSGLPVGLKGEKAIEQHMGIFGTTGSGKSNLVKVLASSMMSQGEYGLLILDVHNEYYKDLIKHPLAKERLCVYNPQPQDSFVKTLQVNYNQVDVEDLTSCATFTEPQFDAIYKMSALWKDSWIQNVLEQDVKDLMISLQEETGQKFNARTLSKIKSVCWNLEQELGLSQEESVVNGLLSQLEQGKVVLIEMKDLSPLGEQALATLLSKKLLQYCADRKRTETQTKPALMVMEEAHRFLGKKELAAQHVFAKLVSEARKFGLGLCVVDQQPRLLADKVLSQLNTLFILGLASKADRNKLETMCRKDILQQRHEIKNLDCGEMILAANYLRFPAPVKVHKLEDYMTASRPF